MSSRQITDPWSVSKLRLNSRMSRIRCLRTFGGLARSVGGAARRPDSCDAVRQHHVGPGHRPPSTPGRRPGPGAWPSSARAASFRFTSSGPPVTGGVRFSQAVSCGRDGDIARSGLLEYFARDGDTDAVAACVENRAGRGQAGAGSEETGQDQARHPPPDRAGARPRVATATSARPVRNGSASRTGSGKPWWSRRAPWA